MKQNRLDESFAMNVEEIHDFYPPFRRHRFAYHVNVRGLAEDRPLEDRIARESNLEKAARRFFSWSGTLKWNGVGSSSSVSSTK